MNLAQKKVEMHCTLDLTERETEMLGWMAGYGPKALAELISKKLTTKYEHQEWEQLWNAMRHELENASKRFAATRAVFEGRMRATDLEAPHGAK